MSNLFCERKTKVDQFGFFGCCFGRFWWERCFTAALSQWCQRRSWKMSRRERMADLEAQALGEQYESMSTEEKMKGIVYER